MSEQTDLERELRRYLLGDMTSEESFRLEESLDSVAMFEQFDVAEQNLIEDYLMDRPAKSSVQLNSRWKKLSILSRLRI